MFISGEVRGENTDPFTERKIIQELPTGHDVMAIDEFCKQSGFAGSALGSERQYLTESPLGPVKVNAEYGVLEQLGAVEEKAQE